MNNKKIIRILFCTVLTIIIMIFTINAYVVLSVENQILKDDYESFPKVDYILVLGAGVWDNKPSPILEDRILEGINLYNKGVSNIIIMTGNNSDESKNEVNVMKEYAISKGVPSGDIFVDNYGINTYESVVRAQEVFNANNIFIVTQEYHLYRSLYIANQLGIEAYGVSASKRDYSEKLYREIREVLARNKDFVKCFFRSK